MDEELLRLRIKSAIDHIDKVSDILPPLIEVGASCSMTLTDQA